jgi:hypothetical protein
MFKKEDKQTRRQSAFESHNLAEKNSFDWTKKLDKNMKTDGTRTAAFSAHFEHPKLNLIKQSYPGRNIHKTKVKQIFKDQTDVCCNFILSQTLNI